MNNLGIILPVIGLGIFFLVFIFLWTRQLKNIKSKGIKTKYTKIATVVIILIAVLIISFFIIKLSSNL